MYFQLAVGSPSWAFGDIHKFANKADDALMSTKFQDL